MNYKLKQYITPILLCLLFVAADAALAETAMSVNDIAKNVTKSIAGVVKLMVLIAYVAGVGFAMGGILQFKAHKDNPTQIPLSKPIVLIAVSAFLLFLPAVMQTAGKTVFDGNAGTTGSSNLVNISDVSASS